MFNKLFLNLNLNISVFVKCTHAHVHTPTHDVSSYSDTATSPFCCKNLYTNFSPWKPNTSPHKNYLLKLCFLERSRCPTNRWQSGYTCLYQPSTSGRMLYVWGKGGGPGEFFLHLWERESMPSRHQGLGKKTPRMSGWLSSGTDEVLPTLGVSKALCHPFCCICLSQQPRGRENHHFIDTETEDQRK